MSCSVASFRRQKNTHLSRLFPVLFVCSRSWFFSFIYFPLSSSFFPPPISFERTMIPIPLEPAEKGAFFVPHPFSFRPPRSPSETTPPNHPPWRWHPSYCRGSLPCRKQPGGHLRFHSSPKEANGYQHIFGLSENVPRLSALFPEHVWIFTWWTTMAFLALPPYRVFLLDTSSFLENEGFARSPIGHLMMLVLAPWIP